MKTFYLILVLVMFVDLQAEQFTRIVLSSFRNPSDAGAFDFGKSSTLNDLAMEPSSRTKRQTTTCGAPSALTQAQQLETVTVHNKYRAQEPASNMLTMSYSQTLATVAQNLSNTCIFAHGMLYGCDGTRYGQNLYIEYTTASTPPPANMTDAIYRFYAEKAYYTFATASCAPNQDCGHYTQVVWATSNLVGCGYTYCPTAYIGSATGQAVSNAVIINCNYIPAGNVILNGVAQQPYLLGATCSNCDPNQVGAGYKCVNSLCVPCSPTNDTACSCTSKPTCQNGGVWNSMTCSCQCTSLYYGPLCQNPCSCNDTENCSGLVSYCSNPSFTAYMTQNCIKTCGFPCIRPASCTATG